MKKTAKTILFSVMVLAFAVIFISCGASSTDNPSGGKYTGTWIMERPKTSDIAITNAPVTEVFTLEIGNGNKGTLTLKNVYDRDELYEMYYNSQKEQFSSISDTLIENNFQQITKNLDKVIILPVRIDGDRMIAEDGEDSTFPGQYPLSVSGNKLTVEASEEFVKEEPGDAEKIFPAVFERK